jgi:TPR repeat protein
VNAASCLCLANGDGHVQDLVSAAGYYERAADLGNPVAMFLYGMDLEKGQGVEQDGISAARFY